MSGIGAGAALGASAGCGALLVLDHLHRRRTPSFDDRVAPYVGSLQPRGTGSRTAVLERSPVVRLLEPTVRAAARRLDLVLGGRAALARRLERSGSSMTVDELRLEQLAWGAAAFGGAFALLLTLLARGSSIPPVAALVLCCCAGIGGVVARDQMLSRRVREREERIAAEFPAIAELLALAVAAGEGAAGAIARVARVCSGELAVELGRVLDDTRTGRGFGDALRALAARIEVVAVSRFVEGVVVAVERGTPLADVLHAQAADARELRRRQLMETAGRREIAMLVPVVFLILPVTVLFALFPGFYGLSLSVP